MSATIQNSALFSLRGWQRVARRIVSATPTGAQWEYLYEGTKLNLPPLAVDLANKGARITMELKAGKSTLSALWGADPGENPEDTTGTNGEEPVDRYDIANEPVQYSIFNHPLVAKEAATYVSTAQYKADLENAAKDGAVFPLDKGNFPVAYALFNNYLTRGIDYWEGWRPVIRKTRTYSENYNQLTTPEKVSPTTRVWTRAALIREFNIPESFQSRIPDDPDPTASPLPPLSVWGWRMKSYNVGYTTQTFKVEESAEWDFAAWSADLYQITT